MFESFQENEQPQHEQEQVKTAVFSIVLGNVDNLSSVYMWALCFKQTANTNKYQWQCNSSGAWEYPDFLQGHDGSQYKQNNKYVVSMFHKSKRTQKTNKAGHNRPLGKKIYCEITPNLGFPYQEKLVASLRMFVQQKRPKGT